jgi:Metallo-peptidase family M12B Reprolysin-like/PKD-like domain/Secretion system C-terminal sorting domain
MINNLQRGTLAKGVLVILMAFAAINVTAQSTAAYWQSLNSITGKENLISENKKNLSKFRLYELDIDGLKEALLYAPMRGPAAAESNTQIYFPDAEGVMQSFQVYEMSNMDPALAAQFPEIKSYVGKGISDPSAIIYFSVSPLGLQTMQLNADKQSVIIEPYTTDKSSYAVYRKGDRTGSLGTFECTMINAADKSINSGGVLNRPNADDGFYRTYRLALSVTGEYTTFFGGTQALALAGMNASMTRVNGVFEVDFGIHMNLIANNNLLIYTNAATDPYSAAGTGAGGAWNLELQQNLTAVIGNAGYDIGHLFGASGGGGNAGCIACVCVNPATATTKAKGSAFTSPADAIPQGDNFDIDYVAHEIGHQFGGNHTFTFSNEGTIAQTEPGSGSTIMGYAGITGGTDVQPHSDAYFHAVSIQQITNYIKTTTCQVNTVTGNAIPTANAGLDYTIPRATPFALTGTSTDANDINLTYCWEQMNVGSPATTFPSVSNATGVAFRSFIQSSSPTRFFPALTTIKAGATSSTWEAVPNVARSMNFRFTVRDNHAGGPANNSDDMIVTVSTASGPFIVTAPNTAVTYAGGSMQTIMWNVASTNAAPVSCANVKVSLSTDGGNTFPTVLSASTPNDGTEMLVIPNLATTTARIKVEAVGNIFFDMSNVNFTITAGGGLTTITTGVISPLSYCAGTAVSVPFTTNGAANTGNIFTAQLSNSAGSFASPVNIGTLTSVNAGTISATIPSGTASGSGYRIRVVSSNPAVTGSTNVSNINITGQVGAAGAINTPPFNAFCANLPVPFSVPVIANATVYNWSVTPPGVIISGAGTNNVTIIFPPDQPDFSATISVFGSNGTCTGASSSTNVTAWYSPTAVISGNTQFCSGKSTLLSAGPAGNFYQWSNGATTPTINVSTAGTFTVTVTSPQTCNSSATVTTTILASPTPVITGNIPFCAGGSATLNAGAGYAAYLWSTGAVTPTINVSTAGTFTVTVTNANACTGTTSATTTVNPLPTVSFTGLATNYAAGAASVTLTGSPAGGTFSGPGISGTTFSPMAAGTGTHTIVYTYTNGNGCTNTASQQTTVGTCTVPARPGTISTTGGTARVCPGQSKTYFISAVAGATSYIWTPPAGSTVTSGQGTTSATINYNAGFIANDSVKVAAVNACGTSQARGLLISRNVPSTPSAITGLASNLCNQNAVPYSVTNVAGMTYNWSFSVVTATVASGAGTNAITANYSPAFTGSASLRVSATNACGTSAQRTLTVRAAPATPASITGATLVCANQFGVPYSTAALAGATNYTWSVPSGARINDGVVTSASTTLTTSALAVTVNFATTSGNVRVRGNNACGSGSYRSLAVAFNCRESEISSGNNLNLSCYPSPVYEVLNVTYTSSGESTASIRIIDIIGKTVFLQANNSVEGENRVLLNLAKLNSGIYMLEVNNNSVKQTQRIVVE